LQTYAFDPFVEDSKMIEDGINPIHEVEDLYKTCQIVSLHLPKTKETVKSIKL